MVLAPLEKSGLRELSVVISNDPKQNSPTGEHMDAVRIAWTQGFRSDAWRSGYLWLGWAVIGGLLPLWGTALLFLLFGKNIALYEFLRNGEFVLYAASFIGGSMYA